jgi:hypothetical protein
MFGKLAKYMQWRVDLLVADHFEDLASEFLLPFVMYQGEEQIVLSSVEELVRTLAQLRAEQRQRGVTRMEARVTAVDLPRHGRFRVWVTYADLDAEGRVLGQSDVILYCREMPEGLKSEMAEYAHCSLPEIWAEPAERRAVQKA